VGAKLPTRLTFGGRYSHTQCLIAESEKWSVEECRGWMSQRIRGLLAELPPSGLAGHGPNWPDWLNAPVVGLTPRNALADEPGRFRRGSYRGPVRLVSTGGTSGRPVTFAMETSASAAEWAYMTRIWSRFGYRPGDRRLVLRGLPPRGDRAVHYDALTCELRVSPFRLGERWWPEIVAEVKEVRVFR
jgi:hypothetical protein